MGLTMADNGGKVTGVIKDSLLTQLIAFAVTNKPQIKRFQIDFEKEVRARHKE